MKTRLPGLATRARRSPSDAPGASDAEVARLAADHLPDEVLGPRRDGAFVGEVDDRTVGRFAAMTCPDPAVALVLIERLGAEGLIDLVGAREQG